MRGFDIWQDHQCIHEEDGYDVDNTQDLYEDIIGWWESYLEDESYRGEDADEFLAKIIVGDEEEELTIAELLE